MSLIKASGISYSYSQEKTVLDNISFSIEKGEYIALLGLNGSGKSTLSRLLAKFFEPQSGTLEMEEGLLPGIVFQHPKEQIVAGIVERDTAFGPQNLKMSSSEVELRTIECLSVVSLAHKAMSRTYDLSLGQTQRLAFAGILALFPDFLILDEVTSSLDPDARNQIIEFVDQWHRKGCTIIHVTHDADEALRAQRVIVLDEGKIAFDGKTDQFLRTPELYGKIFPPDKGPEHKLSKVELENLPVALEAENLSFGYSKDETVFSNISFSLKKGSLTALTGPSGCGKSTLFECLAGLHSFEGKIYSASRPSLCLQESDSALYERFASDDVAFGPANNGVKGKKLLRRVKESMALASIPYETFGNRGTFTLSGGEKRKLAIAGIIALDSDIVIFDEPTSGLDAESRKTIMQSLRKLADSGKTVLFSTHRFEEIKYADQHLMWNQLASPSQSRKEINLPLVEPVKNASLLEAVKRASASLIAPPVIPKSPVKALPAVLKFFLFAAVFISGIAFRNIWVCAAMLLVNVLYMALSRFPARRVGQILRVFIPWILFFAVIEFVFFATTGNVLFQWRFITVTDEKIFSVSRMMLHSVNAIFSMGVFIFSTNEREIMDGLTLLLKPLSFIAPKPVRYFVLVMGITFRYIPLLLEEFTGILKTQIIRGTFAGAKGIKKILKIFPLIAPLFLQSFRKAQYMADALIARYFN